MSPEELEAYARAVEKWLTALQKDLAWRMSVWEMPDPPRVDDYID